ncbi:coiled-coil protein [Legionella busanensis]|uniref:Coiled-coil protein n=1 Tax=Legionella busanensis TaxID=190655 RepID=A0A378JLD4_9GAMM|nr:hypothetical protein [Legionella busanensis]STX51029.1 coiled-coil protein [Legionella busanensis]
MGGELERYQQELDTATKPIIARSVHYQKVISEIRKLLKDYFFNEKRIQKLSEPVKETELVFNYDQIKDPMEFCLVDEFFIENLALANGSSWTTAFDVHIANSNLTIEIQPEKGLYIFKPEKPYTPMAQSFMQQFTYALGVYRLSLGIYEAYAPILNHVELQQIQTFKNYIDSAQNAKELLQRDDIDLLALYRQTKSFKKEILSHLKSEKIHQGINIFRADLDKLTSQLTQLLEVGAGYLENCYKVFPNDPILWMFHDRSWHGLIKNMAALLYANYYASYTLSTTLEIKKEFIALIKNEFEQFNLISSEKLGLLKIELLRKAAKIISEFKVDLQAKLALQGIEIIEAPVVSMFSGTARPSMYQLMAEYYTAFIPGEKNTSGETFSNVKL